MEKRKKNAAKSSPIPTDYAKMVSEVFSTNFDQGLKGLKSLKGATPRFEVGGAIYSDEIVLAVSLLIGKELAATTVYGSSDYDPRASSPTIQDLLSACVDAIGNVFSPLLTGGKKQLEAVADQSLGALSEVPFDWTPIVIDRFKVHVKIDKANLGLDSMADEFLAKNDPEARSAAEEEERATEDLFVTGDKAKGTVSRKPGGGSLH